MTIPAGISASTCAAPLAPKLWAESEKRRAERVSLLGANKSQAKPKKSEGKEEQKMVSPPAFHSIAHGMARQSEGLCGVRSECWGTLCLRVLRLLPGPPEAPTEKPGLRAHLDYAQGVTTKSSLVSTSCQTILRIWFKSPTAPLSCSLSS